MPNAFGGAFSNSSSAFGGSFSSGGGSPYPTAPQSGGLTLRQLMLLKLAEEQSKKGNTGFLHEVLHGGGKVLGAVGHPIGYLFHQIERPFHGVEQGIYNANKEPSSGHGTFFSPFEQFGKGFVKGFSSGGSPSGADIAGQFSNYTPVGKAINFNKHHFAAGVAGFGADVLADPLSFVGFGVKGTTEAINASRTLLAPKSWWDINKGSKILKDALASGADPTHYKYRIALNKLDRNLYKSAKQVALRTGEQFHNKNMDWLAHHFEDNPTNIYDVGKITERNDLAAQAHWEALRHDPRYKTLSLGGKSILQFGKNVALKEHNSALAKLFSNVSRYGEYYPLSIIGIHSGIRTDVIDQLVKGAEQKGLSKAETTKQVTDYIKQFQLRRVKTVLAHGEGVPMQVENKVVKRALRSHAHSIVKAHDLNGIGFGDIADQIGKFDPTVLAHLGVTATSSPGQKYNVVKKLYNAAFDKTALSKLSMHQNPAVVAQRMKTLGGEFKGVAISGKGRNFLSEYRRQFLTDENLHPFVQRIQHYRGILKRGYTGANPFGYAIRNSLTDVWNAALSHTPVVRGMARNTPKAVRMIKGYDRITKKLMRGESLTMAERKLFIQVHKMHDLGILSGLFARDIQEDKPLRDQIQTKSGFKILKETKGRRALHAYATGAVRANELRENTGRVAHYLYRVGKGESPEEAALAVKRAHFDYQDVTPFEQTYLKSVFPFYTWYRKNIPFQLRMLPQKPGQFTRFFHAAQESQQASGDKKQGLIPDYLKDSPTAFRLPFGKNLWMNPALGMQDLQSIEHPIHDAISKIGPPGNLLYAYLANKDNFSGSDLGKKRLIPTNPLLANVLDKIPGLDVGNTKRQVHGQDVQAKGISPWANFLIGQLPAASLLTSANPVSVGHRGLPSFNIPGFGPFPTGPAASYFGGQTLTSPDQQSLAVGQQQNIKNEATAMLQKLYDSGALKPRRHRTSPFDRKFAKASGG